MSSNDKDVNLKEKLKQALTSTFKVISDDLGFDNEDKNKNTKKFDFIEFDNLNTKNDFIKARAETDSSALKKNSLILKFIKKIYP